MFARDDAAALTASRRWRELDPGSIDARQILAAMLIRDGQVDAALDELDWLLDASGNEESQRMRMLANFLSREQDKDAVLDIMARLVERRNGDPRALFAHALLAVRMERLGVANEVMARLAGEADDNIGLSMAYLSLLQKQGKQKLALNWLEQVLESNPDNFDLRLVYARLLADSQRYEQARAQFERLAKAQPENTDVSFALGLLYLQASLIDSAEAQFLGLAKSADRANEAAYYLGQIAESRKQSKSALRWYRQVYSGDNRFDAQLRIAVVLSREEIDKARAQLRTIEPVTSEERGRLVRVEGEMLAEHELFEDAMAVYDKALETGPDVDLLYTRAMLAERMDRLDLLERDLRAILELEPDNSQALNALGYTLADRTERYVEAYEFIERALALSPQDFYILDSMGWVLYRLGRMEESVEYLRKARALRDDPEVAAHLAEVLWVMGEKDQARSIWEAALKNVPDDETLLETIKRLEP